MRQPGAPHLTHLKFDPVEPGILAAASQDPLEWIVAQTIVIDEQGLPRRVSIIEAEVVRKQPYHSVQRLFSVRALRRQCDLGPLRHSKRHELQDFACIRLPVAAANLDLRPEPANRIDDGQTWPSVKPWRMCDHHFPCG